MDIFELVESPVTDSNGYVTSYNANSNSDFQIDQNGEISITVQQGFLQTLIYVRVAATTTYTNKQVENSAYVPLNLIIFGDYCVG